MILERMIFKMPRKINYEQKLSELQEKIEKKQNEIRELRTTYNNLKAQKEQANQQVIFEEIAARNLSTDQVLEALRNLQSQQ